MILTGWILGQARKELYSIAYIYVRPCDLEGMPMSLLEAMSYGNCCLTSDIPECVEVVEGHAATFQHGSVESLREKLQELLENDDLVQRYKANAAEYNDDKYNRNAVTEQKLNLYGGECACEFS